MCDTEVVAPLLPQNWIQVHSFYLMMAYKKMDCISMSSAKIPSKKIKSIVATTECNWKPIKGDHRKIIYTEENKQTKRRYICNGGVENKRLFVGTRVN